MHHIYYSKEKFIETGGKAVFILYHLPKMEGAKRMSEQTYMYEQETAVATLHQVEGFDPRKFMRLIQKEVIQILLGCSLSETVVSPLLSGRKDRENDP